MTGATGLLGPYLTEAASSAGKAIAVSRHAGPFSCDLTDAAAVRRLMNATTPSIVLHAAALTDIETCERDPDRALATNAVATRHLIDNLDGKNVFVYVSTDQVYPDVPGLKREGDEAPVNAYGRSKLTGEREALRHANTIVLRCNLFGPSRTIGRTSLSDWMVDCMKRDRPAVLFVDVLFSPLHMRTLAQTIIAAVDQGLRGTYNLGCREGASKRDFAHLIARHLGLSPASLTDGRSTAIAGRTIRPRDLRLDVSRLEAALGRRMPTLSEEVARL